MSEDLKIQLDMILNSCPDYLVVYNADDGRILFANDALINLFNADRKTFVSSEISLVSNYFKINIFDERYKVFKSPIVNHSLTSDIRDIVYDGVQAKIIYFRSTPMEIEDRFRDNEIIRDERMINAFTMSYVKVYSVSLERNCYIDFSYDNKTNKVYHGVASKAINELINDLCVLEKKKEVKQFTNLKSLPKRLGSIQKINFEFNTKKLGWTRIGFIVTERNEKNEPVSVLFTLRIINAEKNKSMEMEEAVASAMETMKNAENVRTNILTKIGDDIKTPLNTIASAAGMAKQNIDNHDYIDDALNKISESSRQLIDKFSEVLDMTNIETGNVAFTKEIVSIPDLVTNLININKNEIMAHHHNISICLSNLDHEEVYSDKLRIQQIINNVLKNAISYSREKGKIVVTVNEKESIISHFSDFEFIVEDNGYGMEQSFIERAFQPFVRGVDKEVKRTDGTGLGLSIVKSYVEAMGGNISIDSLKGKGTKVTINLRMEYVGNKDDVLKPLAGKKVLFLSDNKRQIKNDAQLIKNLGGSFVSASDGEKAFIELKKAELAHKPIDFIILSYMTDVMDGLEELTKLKKKKGIHLPHIVLTHYDIYTIEEKVRPLGIKNMVKEPLSKMRLVNVFKEIYGETSNNEGIENIRKDKEMKGKKVLVVEDNDICSSLVCEVLDRRGIECFKASDGMEALKVVNESEEFYFDLILMDIQMPKMNGYEATMAIRSLKREDTPIIPIVALSNSSFAEDIASSVMCGMNEHISKPINYGSLYLTLSKWFVGEYSHRKNLEHRAEIDEFTNVFNKTSAFNRIDSYLSNDVVPLSAMLILDLDTFKLINDSYGHYDGDHVIKMTSDIIKANFREKDIIGRFGGDEFIVFMKDIAMKQNAVDKADEIRKMIEKTFHGMYSHNLTCSIGIAFVNETASVNKLFIQADNALYEAKRNGKNKTICAN